MSYIRKSFGRTRPYSEKKKYMNPVGGDIMVETWKSKNNK